MYCLFKEKHMAADEAKSRHSAEPPTSSESTSNPPRATPSPAEWEQLQQEVKRLEEERQRDRQHIDALQQECVSYRQALRDYVLAQITPEELQRWSTEDNEEGCQELHEFIGELESIVRGNAGG